MVGYEVCERLKADPATKNIPIIFVTSMNKVEDEARGLEIGGMDYISSACLRVILMTVKALQNKKGKVVLSALTPYVREIFDVSNFSSIIPITDTVETGLQQVR